MSLRSGKIPNLVQGVSQQPDELRLPTQLNLQEDCFASVVEGVIRRPPTEHIARVSATSLDGAFMHLINRDTTERYQVVVTATGIQVFDLQGASKTVNEVSSSFGYLTCIDPKTQFRALTIADYTFIVNTTVTPTMEATLTTDRDDEALILVKQGEYSSTYSLYIDGTQRATFTTSDTVASTIRTDNIATELYNDLVAWAGAGFTFTRKGSVIHISKSTGDFTVRTEDSQGGTSLYAFKDKTARFSELPIVAPDGFLIAIDANPDTDKGQYYVKAVSNNASETFGEVTWHESVAPGIEFGFNISTMPHALVRQVDGSFNFQTITWDERLVGDATSNDVPSFVGAPIQDLFFYKDRLGFLADEYFILSETGGYFNFWRTTVTQILDTDPIDAKAAHNKVSLLKRALPFNTHLIMFSDQTQFKMPGDAALTPKTFRCDPVSEFEGDMTAGPVHMGQSIFFGFNYKDASGESTGYGGVKELFTDPYSTEKMDAEDLTEHVPAYLPEGIHRLAGSTLTNVCVALTDGDPSRIYVNRTHRQGAKKVQNAWFRWNMGDAATTKVLSASFIESTLILMIERDGEVFLEKLSLIPKRVDAGSTYLTHLDRRVDQDNGFASITYNASINRTTFALAATVAPYDSTTTILVGKDGSLPVILSSNVDSIVVKGDWSAKPVWMGQTYLSRLQPSTIYVRTASPSGGMTIDPVGRLQLLRGYLIYSNTATFSVTVTPEGRTASTYTFTGRIVGDNQNVLGSVALRSGKFQFAILARNDQATIEIWSEGFLPFGISSLEWEGTYTKR